MLDIQIVPQQHHAKFLQRGGDVAPRLSEDAESSDTNPSPKILLQKPHPQKCVLFRKIVLPQFDIFFKISSLSEPASNSRQKSQVFESPQGPKVLIPYLMNS